MASRMWEARAQYADAGQAQAPARGASEQRAARQPRGRLARSFVPSQLVPACPRPGRITSFLEYP